MTNPTAVELLPLPLAEYRLSPDSKPSLHDEEQLTAYARENIAPILAQLSELREAVECAETLRTEQWNRSRELESCLITEQAVRAEWKARAERAEAECAGLRVALREMLELRELSQRGEVHLTRHELDVVRDARAAIDAARGG